jgi:hypothetical protein
MQWYKKTHQQMPAVMSIGFQPFLAFFSIILPSVN